MSRRNNGSLPDVVASFSSTEGGLTAAQVGRAYKAALADFVGGKTSRGAVKEVSRLLAGALAARRQQLAEEGDLSSNRIATYY
jgi:hypothetical protein